MSSIFDKISAAIGINLEKSSSATSQSSSREITPPSTEENALDIPSFRDVVKEHDEHIIQRIEIPVQYLKNYLKAIEDDNLRSNKADILIKELHGVRKFLKEDNDQIIVGKIINSLQSFASPKVQTNLKLNNLFPIYVQRATLLPELFEDFTEAFRWNNDSLEEKKQTPTNRR